jgi:zinc/manganese transport system substrate-binding protein
MLRRSLLMAASLSFVAPALAAPPPLPVVASFSILADMVRQIGGNAVSVTSLVPVDGDAHEYQPKPSDLRAIKGAKLVVLNGFGLEGWIDRLVQSAGYAGPVVIATKGITPRRMEENGAPVTDPHAWQDPRNGTIYARNIADGLATVDPANAAMFRSRADAYIRDIEQTDAWVVAQIAGVPAERRKILTSHDAFGYFGARYGVEFRGVQGMNTESEPSAKDIAALIKLIRTEKIRAVFVENMTSPKLAQSVARETGAVVGSVVYSDALSKPSGPAPTYLGIFRHNVPLFVKGMQAN